MPDFDELLNVPLQTDEPAPAEPTPAEPAEPAPADDFVEYAAPVTDEAPVEPTQEVEPISATSEGEKNHEVEQELTETSPESAAEDVPQTKKEARLVGDRPDRSDAMKKRHADALDKVFHDGVKYIVVEEINLGKEQEKFSTPFGNSGRKGWKVVNAANPEETFYIGANALKIGVQRGNIDPLPPKARGRKAKVKDAETEEAPRPLAAEPEQGVEPLGQDYPPVSVPDFSS